MKKLSVFIPALITIIVFYLTIPVIHAQDMNEMWGTNAAIKQSGKRGRFFADGNYCMFIHWGLYSGIANKWNGKTYYGNAEWIMSPYMANIPLEEYKSVAKDFNPIGFDAKEVAQLAKDAGMKYIIITSKHHDGFAMYHSKANNFNIVDATPYGRDPMKELSEACSELGLGFGFYYSHNQDWTYPGGAGGPRVDNDGNEKTFDDYFNEKCLPQVEEITKNYGEIELVWFDTPGDMPQKYSRQLVDIVHRNQPTALVSGRVGYDLGDYRTLGDMELPLENIEGLWEGINVTNDSWGYAWYDNNWKTPKQILKALITTVARGGTFMMNIGPDGLGRIPAQAKQSLLSAGKWITKYPQVIYGAESSPWNHALPWGDVTVNGNKMYLAVYDWPVNGQLWLPGLQTEIEGINLITGVEKQKLAFDKADDWINIKTSNHSPDEFVSIIEITLKGEISVDRSMAVDPVIGIQIPALYAKAVNCSVEYKEWMEKFGEWKHSYNVKDWRESSLASFDVNIKDEGIYNIDLTYQGQGRMVWGVTTDEGFSIQNQQNSSNIYARYPIGWIKFDKPGKHTITVKLLEGNSDSAGLASISITPVRF